MVTCNETTEPLGPVAFLAAAPAVAWRRGAAWPSLEPREAAAVAALQRRRRPEGR